MAKSQIDATVPRKSLSTLNGLRAAVFFSAVILFIALTVGGYLLGNAVAFDFPYLIAAMVLASYLVRSFFRISPRDALFATDDEIRAARENAR